VQIKKIMKEVTRQVRWDVIKDKDVSFSFMNDYPYSVLWKDRQGNIVAKDVPIVTDAGVYKGKKYYIAE